jgi:ribonuclease D
MSNRENEHLRILADGARASGRIALDTEFMGEGRYRTLLCLIQLAIPEEIAPAAGGQAGEERIVLLDALDESLDGSPLATVLADPAVEVVVHAGRQDIALLRRYLRTEVTNVFDTQIAAGFAGLGAQSSYESLLAEILGLRVAKTASFTRWDARPLSPEQLAYAREDVVHLLELASELQRRLSDSGRLQWAREECEPLARSSDERDPEVIFARLPRVASLNASARPTARALVRWREEAAARSDRTVQSVLGDHALLEIAKRRPQNRAELTRIRGVGAAAGGRRSEEVLEVIRGARYLPPEQPPARARTAAPRPNDAPLIALGEALLRARAREANLAYELLAARADLQAIVAGARSGEEADVRTLRGWRRELVGSELLALLDGRIALSVDGSGEHRSLRIQQRD